MTNTLNYAATVWLASVLFGLTTPVVIMATVVHLVNSGDNADI
jgi:hypothetical protein